MTICHRHAFMLRFALLLCTDVHWELFAIKVNDHGDNITSLNIYCWWTMIIDNFTHDGLNNLFSDHLLSRLLLRYHVIYKIFLLYDWQTLPKHTLLPIPILMLKQRMRHIIHKNQLPMLPIHRNPLRMLQSLLQLISQWQQWRLSLSVSIKYISVWRILSEWVSEWVLVNVEWAICQLHHGENKSHFNEMMLHFTLY